MSESNQNPANDINQDGAPPALPLSVNLQYTKDLSFEVPAGAAILHPCVARRRSP